MPIHAERRPRTLSPCGSQIGTAMLLAPTYKRRCYVVCPLFPAAGNTPAAFGYQIMQAFANGEGPVSGWHRPFKFARDVFPDSHKNHARPQLRHAEVAGVEQPPLGDIPEFAQIILNVFPVGIEHGIQQATDILKHDRARPDFIDKPYSFREQIPLVTGAKLFTGYRKRRARHTAGKKIDAFVRSPGEFPHVSFFESVPVRTVQPECTLRFLFYFNQCKMFKTGHLQTQGLPSGPGANLHGTQPRSSSGSVDDPKRWPFAHVRGPPCPLNSGHFSARY